MGAAGSPTALWRRRIWTSYDSNGRGLTDIHRELPRKYLSAWTGPKSHTQAVQGVKSVQVVKGMQLWVTPYTALCTAYA